MERKIKFPPKVCERCHEWFEPRQWNQKYCGSKRTKVGCSYENERARLKSRTKCEQYRDYQRQYQRASKKNHRAKNTDYAQRQRASKRAYSKSNLGKKSVQNYRQRHADKILQRNRKRRMFKQGIFGYHTQEQWEHLKLRYNNRCAECGVSEEELASRYPNTQFYKLTRDHIVPTSKGGTDIISNIQPLCIGCNSKKHQQLPNINSLSLAPIISLEHFENFRGQLGRIVCTSCPADPIHPGHVSCLVSSTQYGDSLVVIVNGDWFLRNKKGVPFMPLELRCLVISSIRGVTAVIPFEIEGDATVCKALEVIRPHVFTKGGDRTDRSNIPEWEICEKYGIQLETGVGDPKIHSSSNLLEDWYQRRLLLFREDTLDT